MPTEDGWEPSPRIEPDSPLLVWRQVPGTDVNLQVRDDDIGRLMLAYAADYHLTVEHLTDSITACYTPTNSVDTSNHLNATAMDFDWTEYPWKQRGNLTGNKLVALRALLAFYAPWMFWAGDWDDAYVDEMHHQANYGTYADPNIDPNDDPDGYRQSVAEHAAALRSWVTNHIRSDGFSTYRHDPEPGMDPTAAPPPVDDHPDLDAVTALYDAVPVINMARAAELLPLIRDGLIHSECVNVQRIAMWLAQIGYESGGFIYTEEIAKNGRYAPYIGRTWIQITWESNYAAFGQWCADHGLIDNADQFVNDPQSLADVRWAAIGPAWYWTVQRPQINGMCDDGDLVGVTQAINGGTNGLDGVDNSRRERYTQALGVGDRLLSLIAAPTGDDDMFTDDDRRLLLALAATKQNSRSPLRHLGEGPVNTPAEAALGADGLSHPVFVFMAAKIGHRDSIALLGEVAGGDPAVYPDRADDIKMAKAMLADIEATNPGVLQAFLKGATS